MTRAGDEESDGPRDPTTAHRTRRPERLAALARLLQPLLMDSLALQADRIADDLARHLGLVAWERERLIGHAQRELTRLRDRRFGHPGGPPIRIVERRMQPLECLAPSWEALRRGRAVHVEAEEGAIPQLLHLLSSMAALVGGSDLTIARMGAPTDARYATWPSAGVEPAAGRVALVQEDADPELAAYLLARAGLRRTGFDPRCVHQVVVVGRADRLERHLLRLWHGVRMGPVDDEQAFAGPVAEPEAQAFESAERSWVSLAGAERLCPGGRLEMAADAPGRPVFLAPSLLRAADQPPVGGHAGEEGGSDLLPAPVGPLLILHPCAHADAGEALLARLSARGEARLRMGARPRGLQLGTLDRQLHGALLVERLPPGLPDPRP